MRLVKTRKLDALRLIYGSVPDTLSQLIRTAFVAPEGHVLIDADFSAIEARVIAWLAGEQWRLEVFRTHGKKSMRPLPLKCSVCPWSSSKRETQSMHSGKGQGG